MSNTELTITSTIADRPNTVRFTLNQTIAGERSRSYADAESAADHPLARHLFEIDGVRSVLVRENMIVVTKAQDAEWPELLAGMEMAIREEFAMAGRRHRLVPHGHPPGSGERRQMPTGVRVRVPSELRMIVGWLLAALSVAQLFWIFPTWDTSRREPLLVRLAMTLALLLFWLMFTEKKQKVE